MSCINEDLIQKYIDGETDPGETALIKNHIATCLNCDLRIKAQHKLAMNIRKAINNIQKEPVEIPVFIVPDKNKKILTPGLIRFTLATAAACVIFILFVVTNKRELKTQDEIFSEMSSAEVNANKPATDFPLILNFIDADGNVSEFYIE